MGKSIDNAQIPGAVTDKQAEPDVADTPRLEKFRKKREEWISWLAGEDMHAIWKQIASLQLDYGLFLTVNDLRKEAGQNPVEGVGFNVQVMRLLDAGFVATQATGIRRLVDKRTDVISLKRLVEDMRDNRELMTRETYLGSRKLPYDFAAARHLRDDQLIASGQFASFKGIDPSVSESERAHERFDKLSKVSPNNRSRIDLISQELFDRLRSKIDVCADMRMFATKFIAHAADLASRSGLTPSQMEVTLARLAECHQALAQVTEFVGCRILQCSTGASVPTPSSDPVENLDKAWTGVRDFEKGEDNAGKLWERNWQSVKQWESEALRRFEQEHA